MIVKIIKSFAVVVVVIITLVVLAISAFVINEKIKQRNIPKAKEFLINAVVNGDGDMIVSEIEKYRNENGVYPSEEELYKIELIANNNLMKKCGNEKCVRTVYSEINKNQRYYLSFCFPKEFESFPCSHSLCVQKGNIDNYDKLVDIKNDWYYLERLTCL